MRAMAVLFTISLAIQADVTKAVADLDKLAAQCRAGKAKECQKLAETARTHKDPKIRAEAVARVTDPAVLAALAANDPSPAVREAAVKNEKLVDTAVLAEIAGGKGDLYQSIREAAFKRITDQAVLAKIVLSMNASNRVAATPTTDLKISADRLISHRIVERIDDQTLLQQIARAGEGAGLRAHALQKVTDPPADLWNDVLLSVIREKAWPEIPGVAGRAIPLSAEVTAVLTPMAARKDGVPANIASALIGGLPVSSWPRFRSDYGLGVREGAGGAHPMPEGRVAPGPYRLTVSYSTIGAQSKSEVPVDATLAPGRCYFLDAGKIGDRWSPRILEQPCPAK